MLNKACSGKISFLKKSEGLTIKIDVVEAACTETCDC